MKNQHHMYDLCKQHMHSYVLAETTDGTKFDGIITGLDEEYVYFAVPIDPTTQHDMDPQSPGMYGQMPHMDGQYRYGFPGYGFGYPGYGYGYGYGRPRRFRRLVLPLAALVALSTLPWY
ncbi:hypothetical protein [Oceanobacillus halophilus]|uniref:Phosphatidylinositol kinase n=1 Tax=Oceanobacillus halophilus TaxID=930130 RepID=A0A495A0D2_9BACI|nr:hypothetical protein [Oceanobacillus halophilus]RKQ32616.1 hypothetical protein D8M06_11800 [Oceanobacillus halophilus]